MEVFFHIGLQKTGTTFLQREIFNKIQDSDFAYIDGHFHPDVFNPIRFQDPIFFDSISIRDKITALAKGKKKLLVSFEDLSGHPYNAAQARSVIADKIRSCFPQAKVIFFLRRQDTFAVSSYLQTVNGGNKYSLREYYSTVFEDKQHERFICPTLDYFLFSKYVDHLTGLFGRENCLILPYERFRSENEVVIKQLLDFLNVKFIEVKLNNKHNRQKGEVFTWLLRFENYFVARRISANSAFYSGIPIYNFRTGKTFHFTLKYVLTLLLRKGLWMDIRYTDRSGSAKRILELCREDNKALELKYSLGLTEHGYC